MYVFWGFRSISLNAWSKIPAPNMKQKENSSPSMKSWIKKIWYCELLKMRGNMKTQCVYSFQCMIIVFAVCWCTMMHDWFIARNSRSSSAEVSNSKFIKLTKIAVLRSFLETFRWFSSVWNLEKSTLVFQVQFFRIF